MTAFKTVRTVSADAGAPHRLLRCGAAAGGSGWRLCQSGEFTTAKAWGIRDMAFCKKAGLRIEDMVRSNWVYRKLRNFRAGIEAGISCLKAPTAWRVGTTTKPLPSTAFLSTKPRSTASSQTVRRGQDVRHTSNSSV